MKKTVEDFELKNKTIILRCDLNISIKDNEILDDTKIKESIKTIKYILDNNAKLIILSHLGRIEKEADKKNNSLKIVCDRLNELIENKITFVPYTKNNGIKEIVNNLKCGEGIMLENTRFEDLDNDKESNCDMELAKYWASLGDIFINDAFGTIHRKHASNFGISNYLESGIGFLIAKEILELNKLDNPIRPFSVIMGGSKISDKLGLISSLTEKADYILIGSGMALTFLKAQGLEIGKSNYEKNQLETCKDLLGKYKDKLILPIDFKGSKEVLEEAEIKKYNYDEIPEDVYTLDIGEKTIELYKEKLKNTKTVFWNGPLGYYEDKNYIKGTQQILEFVADNIDTSILGGGDIIACANQLNLANKVTFTSTGGGASLEYLENKNLPGLINIKEK